MTFKLGDKVTLDPNNFNFSSSLSKEMRDTQTTGKVHAICNNGGLIYITWPNGETQHYTKYSVRPAKLSLREKVVQEFKDKRAAALQSIATNQTTIDELYAQVELRTAEVQEYDNLLISLGAE